VTVTASANSRSIDIEEESMGLFDNVVSGVMKGVLGQVEAGALPALLSQLLARTDLGNVGGLLEKLQESGLGKQVGSWLGNGTNLPISPDQLRAALGDERLQQLARSAGLPIDQLLAILSQHLPQAIDKMSPNGALEENPADEDAPEEKGESLADQAGLKDMKG